MDLLIKTYDLELINLNNLKCYTEKDLFQIDKFDNSIIEYDQDNDLFIKNTKSDIFKINLYTTNSLLMNDTDDLNKTDFLKEYVFQKESNLIKLISNTFRKGYEIPSNVQKFTIPYLMDQKDAIIQFKSGTGKTHAFLFGLLSNFDIDNQELQLIFITSSHEVAWQIYEHINSLVPENTNVAICIGNKNTSGFKNIKTITISEEKKKVMNAQIIIGTVGKIYNWINYNQNGKKLINTKYIKAICIDEFDQIIISDRKNNYLDNNSTESQIKIIMNLMPEKTQRVFISATVDDNSLTKAESYFRKNNVTKPFIFLLPKENFTLEGIKQYYIELDINTCHDIDYEKKLILGELITHCRISQCIIFANKIKTAENIQRYFMNRNPPILSNILHGSMDSNERKNIVNEFRSGSFRYLVSTDLTARGFDITGINLIINYEMPDNLATYIHRIGRSGRYGKKGVAISLIMSDEKQKIEEIKKYSMDSKISELPDNITDLL